MVKSFLKKREAEIRKVLVYTLGLNLFVALIKIIAGHEFHFLSLSSSGLESLFDGSSNIVSLIAITLAAKPGDKKHNYGHHKHETLGSIFISGLLFTSALQLAFEYKEVILENKIITGDFGVIPVATILISMAVSFFVSTYEKREGERLKSSLLLADSAHTYGDLILSVGVLFSIICSYFGWYWPDIIIGICIILFLIYMAVSILRQNLDDLLDSSPEMQEQVLKEIESLPDVYNVHHFRARGNANWMQVDFHMLLTPDLSLVEAHELSHKAEDILKDHLRDYCNHVDVTIHIEPYEKEHVDP